MAYSFTVADVAYLTGSAGVAALRQVDLFELSQRTMVGDIGRARTRWPEHAAALVETVRLRRKAAAKLDQPQRWLLTEDALQQATPSAVARKRAQRLVGRVVHDLTCSVGADLHATAAVAQYALGSDLDPVRLAMAAHNVPGVPLARADALRPVSRGTTVLADPARRDGGRRTLRMEDLVPPLPALLETYRGRDIAVKCAPGIDYDALGWEGEVELVSLDGAVREACLWSPGLAGAGVSRRATVLRGTVGGEETVTDLEPDDLPERPPGQWIIDPDGAVVRAGLVRHYGARHGLWQLDPRIAYLTGDAVPLGARGFRVLDSSGFSERTLKAELARLDCGVLEILVRGVDIDPDALRKRLKLRGKTPLAAVITRIGAKPVVFVCAPGVRRHT